MLAFSIPRFRGGAVPRPRLRGGSRRECAAPHCLSKLRVGRYAQFPSVCASFNVSRHNSGIRQGRLPLMGLTRQSRTPDRSPPAVHAGEVRVGGRPIVHDAPGQRDDAPGVPCIAGALDARAVPVPATGPQPARFRVVAHRVVDGPVVAEWGLYGRVIAIDLADDQKRAPGGSDEEGWMAIEHCRRPPPKGMREAVDPVPRRHFAAILLWCPSALPSGSSHVSSNNPSPPRLVARSNFRGCRDDKPADRRLLGWLRVGHDKHVIFGNRAPAPASRSVAERVAGARRHRSIDWNADLPADRDRTRGSALHLEPIAAVPRRESPCEICPARTSSPKGELHHGPSSKHDSPSRCRYLRGCLPGSASRRLQWNERERDRRYSRWRSSRRSHRQPVWQG